MTPMFFKKFALVLFAFSAGAILTIRYAYASSSTGYPNPSGDGLGLISGYVITDVSYEIAQSSSQVVSVSFNLDAAADFVRIQLTNTQSYWDNCTNTGGFRWTCNTNISLSTVNQLRVMAGEN